MNLMQIQTSGSISYSPEISGIIEGIANSESRIASRSRQDRDDIKQEIRMACIKALNQYDPSRIGPSPYAYLLRCAKNHLFNLNRGVLVPNNPPCTRCELWDKLTKSCSVKEVGCSKIVEYRKSMEAKASIKHADNLGDYDSVDGKNSSVSAFELHDMIVAGLPRDLLPDFAKMSSGLGHTISSRRRSQIRKIVRRIISDG